MLLDVRASRGVDGARVEKVLEKCLITVNKNTVPGDDKPLVPSGVRIGTPALTSRGLKEGDFSQVAEFIARGVEIAALVNKEKGADAKLVTFVDALSSKEWPQIAALRTEVAQFAQRFHMPGQE
jgi:glycine hydroxymethyltransferase